MPHPAGQPKRPTDLERFDRLAPRPYRTPFMVARFRVLSLMIQKQRLLFVTGTRADFGKIEPLAKAAIADGFSVSFFVTGMHMLESYGLTKIEVNRLAGASSMNLSTKGPVIPKT